MPVQVMSPDDSLLAQSDGSDIHLIDTATSKNILTMNMGSDVLSLEYSTTHYWLLIVTQGQIVVLDLESKYRLMEHPNTYQAGKVTWSEEGDAVIYDYGCVVSELWPHPCLISI